MNSIDPSEALRWVVDYGIYMPGWLQIQDISAFCPRSYSNRFWEVATLIQKGLLIQALAALDIDEEKDEKNLDWADIGQYLNNQPEIAKRIASMHKPASRHKLISLLRSLSDPFTLVRTQWNELSKRPFCYPWPVWLDDQN